MESGTIETKLKPEYWRTKVILVDQRVKVQLEGLWTEEKPLGVEDNSEAGKMKDSSKAETAIHL
ncbi:MAG: hypothetical protein ACRCZO_11310 [Cetobacterium sp.]